MAPCTVHSWALPAPGPALGRATAAVAGGAVIATASLGDRAVSPLGGPGADLGHRPDPIASAQTPADGIGRPLGTDGVAQPTAPAGIRGGRDVAHLGQCHVLAALAAGPSGRAIGAAAGGLVQPSSGVRADLAGLRALPAPTPGVARTRDTGIGSRDLPTRLAAMGSTRGAGTTCSANRSSRPSPRHPAP